MKRCPKCNVENADDARTCRECGQVLSARSESAEQVPLAPAGAAGKPVIPAVPPGTQSILLAGEPAGPLHLSPLARAAGWLGLLSLLLMPAPIALIVGALAIRDLRRHPTRHGFGRALFGLAMGTACTGLLLWLLITRYM